jgi:hypothetical protein
MADPQPRRFRRAVALCLVVAGVAGVYEGLRVLWMRQRVLSGDLNAADGTRWARAFAHEALAQGETGEIRALGACGIRFNPGGADYYLDPQDLAALETALSDESAIVRVCALDALLESRSEWTSGSAIDALERLLDDDVPISPSLRGLNEAWLETTGRPLTPAGWAIARVVFVPNDLLSRTAMGLSEVVDLNPKLTRMAGRDREDLRSEARARLAHWRASLASDPWWSSSDPWWSSAEHLSNLCDPARRWGTGVEASDPPARTDPPR